MARGMFPVPCHVKPCLWDYCSGLLSSCFQQASNKREGIVKS